MARFFYLYGFLNKLFAYSLEKKEKRKKKKENCFKDIYQEKKKRKEFQNWTSTSSQSIYIPLASLGGNYWVIK